MGDFVNRVDIRGTPQCPQCWTRILVTFNPVTGPEHWYCIACEKPFAPKTNEVEIVIDQQRRI